MRLGALPYPSNGRNHNDDYKGGRLTRPQLSGFAAAAAQVESLTKQLRRHEHRYYVLDRPEISDADFDELMRQLKELEQRHPSLLRPNSPTQRVGGAVRSGAESAPHSAEMLSLENAANDAELAEFHRRVCEDLGAERVEFVGELKFDGASLAVRYEEGKLALALTRGDGENGEVVTPNARTVRSLPLEINRKALSNAGLGLNFEVRGEVVITKREFAALKSRQSADGGDEFIDPRNTAAGLLRKLDPSDTATGHLDFFPFALLVNGRDHGQSQFETLEMLDDLGFKANPGRGRMTGLNRLRAFRDHWFGRREELAYAIDGLVFKVDSLQSQDRLGATAKSPRWAIAAKPPPPWAETNLVDVDFQVGRTGAITPRAHLEPVKIGNVTVSRATLHNFDQIVRLELQIGDRIRVERSGEVIPKVAKVVRQGRSRTAIQAPDVCPSCATKLPRTKEVVLRCPNPNCPARVMEMILHFGGRSAMYIEGLGSRIVEQLVDLGWIRDAADLYALKRDQLIGLERDGILCSDQQAARIAENLASARPRVGLARVLYALGIPDVGPVTAKFVADRYRSLGHFADEWSVAEAIRSDFPDRLLQNLESFFRDQVNRRLVRDLLRFGPPYQNGFSPNIEIDSEPSPWRRDKLISFLASVTDPLGMERPLPGWVEGFGTVLAQKLVDEGRVQRPADIYTADADLFERIPIVRRTGPKFAENLTTSLERSKTAGLDRLLVGLGIRHVGPTAARLLANHYTHLDRIAAAEVEEMADVGEVGEITAGAVHEFFADPNTQDVLERLREGGVQFSAKRSSLRRVVAEVDGKTFVLSGSLTGMTRRRAADRIRAAGGRVTGSVSSNTDYLIAGDRPGGKLQRAKDLGVEIIDENELLALLGA